MKPETLLEQLLQLPIRNSHTHQLPDEEQRGLTLPGLLRHSYVSWCGPVPSGKNREDIIHWLEQVRSRSYFVFLEKSLQHLYGISRPLSADSWEEYDAAIQAAHQKPDWHLQILQEKCQYESILLDAYWKPGDNNRHPSLFSPALRVNSFFYGYNRTALDHNGNNAQRLYGETCICLEDYLEFVRRTLQKQHKLGCRVFKCALAYDRNLSFGEASQSLARRAMMENPQPEEIAAFQSAVFDCICEQAACLGIPVQIHTGLGLLQGSRAMLLYPLITRHPQTTFWLMHGSYPWIQDILGLVHTCKNVWADLCWLPLISPHAAARFLPELLDVCNTDRMIWGCDTWTGEESFGARLAFLRVLSDTLARRVNHGLLAQEDALRLAKRILSDNLAFLGNKAGI